MNKATMKIFIISLLILVAYSSCRTISTNEHSLKKVSKKDRKNQKDSVLIQAAHFIYQASEPIYQLDSQRFLVQSEITAGIKIKWEIVTESVYKKEAADAYNVIEPVYKITQDSVQNKKGEWITFRRKTIEKPATYKKIEIPAEYGVISKRVLGVGTAYDKDAPAIPAVYNYFKYQKLIKPAELIKVEVPAVYLYF